MEEFNQRYIIKTTPIGKGSFGEVYIGMDTLTKKEKAIKIMNLSDEEVYKNELAILKKIADKKCFRHLICLTDYFIYKNKIILITDMISGITLSDFFRQKLNFKISKYDISFIIYQLIYAIYYIHNIFKMAHIDIKPENIMIDPNTLELSIIDVGLACEEKCIGGGTLYYMSPEYYKQFVLGNKITVEEGKKTDMYAIGLIIYQLIFGKDSIYEYGKSFDKYVLLYENLNDKKEYIRTEYTGIRSELISILKNMLQPDSEKRYTSEKIYKQLNKWKKMYEKRLLKPLYIERRRSVKITEEKECVISPLLTLLDSIITLADE